MLASSAAPPILAAEKYGRGRANGKGRVLLTRSAEHETIWAAAGAWEPLVDGSIRFAERVYAWLR